MRQMIGAGALWAALLSAGTISAETYYFSPTGNDTLDGTSPATAWKNLDMIYQMRHGLVPGDEILLERNGIWPSAPGDVGNINLDGVVGSPERPIRVASYGPGENRPVVYGSSKQLVWHNASSIPGVTCTDCWYAPVGEGVAIQNAYDGSVQMSGVSLAAGLDLHDPADINTYLANFNIGSYGPRLKVTNRVFVRTGNTNTPPSNSQTRIFWKAASVFASNDIIIEQLDLREGTHGATILASSSITLRDLAISDTLQFGVQFGGLSYPSTNVSLIGSAIARSGKSSVYFQNAQRGLVSGNDLSTVRNVVLGYDLSGYKDKSGIGVERSRFVTIERNAIHDNDTGGIDVYLSDSVDIRRNFLYNAPLVNRRKYFLALDATNSRVHHNIAISGAGSVAGRFMSISFLRQTEPGVKNWIYNNSMYGASEAGVLIGAPAFEATTYFFNNLVVGKPGASNRLLTVQDASKTVSDYNCFQNATEYSVNGVVSPDLSGLWAAGLDQHSNQGDPKFLSSVPGTAEDFQLQATSPCLDAGMDPQQAGLAPLEDALKSYDGRWFGDGEGKDIGAYEAPGFGTFLSGLRLASHFNEPKWVIGQPSVLDVASLQHGTPTSGAAPGVVGFAGYGASFDGVSGLIAYPTLGSWNPSQFTISFWVNPDAAQVGINPYVVGEKFLVRYLSSLPKAFQFTVQGTAGNSTATSTVAVAPGNWYHVTCVYDDAANGDRAARIYVNGATPVAGASLPGALVDKSSRALLVGSNLQSNRFFKGAVDELMVWDRVLTASEVAELYSAGPP